MNKESPALLEEPDTGQIRHLEPDWVESEWFQVWLELARQPHKSDCVEKGACERYARAAILR